MLYILPFFSGNDAFEVQASRFKVSDLQGRALFSADKNEVIVGAEILRLSGGYALIKHK